MLLHFTQGHALHLSEGLARKLAVEAVLDGHDGCVNRLAWNEDGSMLATASDDCQVGLLMQQQQVLPSGLSALTAECRHMCAGSPAMLQDIYCLVTSSKELEFECDIWQLSQQLGGQQRMLAFHRPQQYC